MRTRLLFPALLLAAHLAAAENPWSQLQVGMPESLALDLLGEPLVSTRGHGFVTWTYDGGAEVLLLSDGRVVGWTTPAEAATAARSHDLWRNLPPGKHYATMHAALATPLPRKSPSASAPGEILRASQGQGFEEYYRNNRALF